MANILDPMDLKQILTLHIDGLSNRRIAVILGISRNTVNTYIKLFSASDYPFTSLLELAMSTSLPTRAIIAFHTVS
ncbi:sigma factor-like helix-turn-helix DNA-binding protein [Sphingobacterium sp. NPDC055431]